MNELQTALTKQNYSKHVIKKGIEKVLSMNREDLRTVRQKTQENILTFVSTFTKCFKQLNKTYQS